jgi:uncharacterized protein YukE
MASVSGLDQQVTKMADQIQSAGKALNDSAVSANWTGSAAEQFRDHAQSRSKDFQNCVSLLDTAAVKLAALAAKVG